MCHNCETPGPDREPRPFDPFILVVIACDVASTMVSAVAGGGIALTGSLLEHSQYRRKRREFAATVQNTVDRL